MRHLVLSEDGVHVAADAYHRLLAASYFPESLRDQEQALLIARIECAAFRAVGAINYRPSEIMEATAHRLEKRTAQHFSVALVVFAYLWLKQTQGEASLKRAAIIAAYAASEGKVIWRPALEPKSKERVSHAKNDPDAVERVFRRYRSVAHLIAARVAVSARLEARHLWDEDRAITASLVRGAIFFQSALERAADVKPWNLWDVKQHFPKSLIDLPIPVPDSDLIQLIERGKELAIKAGLMRGLKH